MSLWMSLLNNVAVSVFGSVLAASFCDALDRRKNRIIFWICIALIPIAQGIIYYVWEDGFLRQIYPLLVHVPLILLLCGLTGKLLWPPTCAASCDAGWHFLQWKFWAEEH